MVEGNLTIAEDRILSLEACIHNNSGHKVVCSVGTCGMLYTWCMACIHNNSGHKVGHPATLPITRALCPRYFVPDSP
jgi:hypothetical protein